MRLSTLCTNELQSLLYNQKRYLDFKFQPSCVQNKNPREDKSHIFKTLRHHCLPRPRIVTKLPWSWNLFDTWYKIVILHSAAFFKIAEMIFNCYERPDIDILSHGYTYRRQWSFSACWNDTEMKNSSFNYRRNNLCLRHTGGGAELKCIQGYVYFGNFIKQPE